MSEIPTSDSIGDSDDANIMFCVVSWSRPITCTRMQMKIKLLQGVHSSDIIASLLVKMSEASHVWLIQRCLSDQVFGGCCSELIKFRKAHPLLGRSDFLRPTDITWHEDNWDNSDSRYLAFTLHDLGQGGGDLYVAFNAHTFAIDAHLPRAPEGKTWRRVVDTNLQAPKDITPGGNKGVDPVYSVHPFSSILLVAK